MEILTDIANKIGFDWRLSLTHLINFLIIFFLLVKFALPKIKQVVNERNKKIEEGLKLRADADKLVKDAEESSKEISRQANQRAEKIAEKGESNAKEILRLAEEKATDMVRKAEAERGESKDRGLKDAETILKKEIANILSKISTNAFDGKLTAQVNSDFITKVFKL